MSPRPRARAVLLVLLAGTASALGGDAPSRGWEQEERTAALEALRRTRLEQALVRAERTAVLLGQLPPAPSAEEGP